MIPEPIKALAVKQPWASLLASGRKTIELRSWRTHYRGPLVIVASLRPARVDLATLPYYADLDRPLGAAIAIVELVDVRPFEAGDERPGKGCVRPHPARPGFSWIVENPRALSSPVPVKARLGIFSLTDEAAIHAIQRGIVQGTPLLSHGNYRASAP